MNANELIEYLETMMKDEFVATIVKQQNGLHIKFLNGKAFIVKVEEC